MSSLHMACILNDPHRDLITQTHTTLIPFVLTECVTVTRSFRPKKPLTHTVTQKQKHEHQTNYLTKKRQTQDQPITHTCIGNKVLLLLSVRNKFSSIQDLGPIDPPVRGNFGGAMTLLEKGFFRGETWLAEPGTPMPLLRRWSRPQDIPPEPQPFPWWLPQGDCFTMGCSQTSTQGHRGGGRTGVRKSMSIWSTYISISSCPASTLFSPCPPQPSLICSCDGWVDKKIWGFKTNTKHPVHCDTTSVSYTHTHTLSTWTLCPLLITHRIVSCLILCVFTWKSCRDHNQHSVSTILRI